jgi:hypothetical protein
VQRGAHTLTRWLGADESGRGRSRVCGVTAVGPGSLCCAAMDSGTAIAADIARFCSGTDATAAARALTEYALGAGGQDNITVAIVPIGGRHEFG